MPPLKNSVRRAVTNENDENAGTTRVTRAKAAALSTNDSAGDPPKKALQRSRSAATSTAVGIKKRAALGDVSNVAKNESVQEKEGKKAGGAAKGGLVSKAAQTSRVQKPARSHSTRSILGPKDRNAGDLKRPNSGSGISGNVSKKRHTGSSDSKSIAEEEENQVENIAPPKQANGRATAIVEISKTVTKTTKEEVIAVSEPEARVIPDDVNDLDAEDHDDPLMVSEYVSEIFEYLREVELRTMANANYMRNQDELEWKMRGILVDWLLEVHTRFRLLPETLFLAVNIIDRFLSAKVVQLDRLQLVGVTAMFIASKYEEVLSPHVQNFRHVADDGFTEDEILSAERFVLAALNYDLSYPNPMNFLRRISKADDYDIHSRTIGKYLLEISCLDHRFIAYPPSQIAAAAMYLSRKVLERGDWNPTIAYYAGYTEEEIQPVFDLMVDYLHGPVVHEAFFKKYASKKFLKASIRMRSWAKAYHAARSQEDEDGESY
ncbi:A/B/D/E cyclin [Aulographum hederae CBS 113979]|uniref:A/B/D/E cyclin n=1 Tax=Aulographum hederae CBS 113979 TaxID=1176131 RepID=A0A6G1H8S2_9PEZI|nr:A/B/D/E cyclin [Aulographum hederae CBS 113979]